MFSRRVWRDDGLATVFGQPISELAGVICTVRDQSLWCRNARQQGRRADEIVNLTWRYRKGERTPDLVGYGVNLGRPSAARSYDGLFEVPPFAPDAERCALT